ncbi:MAG TPA: hypothetical protein VK453_07545 [Micromonosporaceae bacterium]|nr:hypothetical protein [Micromonosporaceae bacterium]
MTTILGIDAGHTDLRAAEHWLHAFVDRLDHPDGLMACTHLVRQPFPHVAISLSMPSPMADDQLPDDAVVVGGRADRAARRGLADLARPAHLAAQWHTTRRGGRAVVYPGVERLTGLRTVGEVLSWSAIDRIALLGGSTLGHAEPPLDMVVDTRDFLRPQWKDGTLTLLVQQAAGARLVPFEVPDPTPCCS